MQQGKYHRAKEEAETGNIDFNVEINVRGGGEKSQVEAARLALAKAIVKFSGSEELTKAFLSYDRNLLVDTRNPFFL